jgi:putative aminopeptidase FrvX
MEKEDIGMLCRLSDANGISGFEDQVLETIRKEAKGLGTFSEDSLRDLYLVPEGNKEGRPMVQLDAHSDEVGFMVKDIRPDGLLEFITIGGWVANNIPAHMVRVLNDEGTYIPGVVATKPPHFMTEAERKAPVDVATLAIDVGARSAEEITNDYKISVAAPIVPDVACIFDEKHRLFIGKAFDNRFGCGSIISTIRSIKGLDRKVNVTGAFASQEEVGTRGATVTVQRVKPDIAICFEGCPADDTVVPSYQAQTSLGKGPMLRAIDARMITNPRFQKYALSVAKELGIPYQVAVRSGGATDGGPIHLGSGGVPSIVIGIPVRYAHTHYGISSLDDYENGVRLAVGIITRLDAKTIAGF